MRTEYSATPLQLFYTPVLEGTYDPPTIDPSYWVKTDGPVPTNEKGIVVVDPVNIHLIESQFTILCSDIKPLKNDSNFGISLYLHARELIHQLLH